MTLDVSGDIPKITLKESLVGVDVGAALSATDITDKLEGFGNLEADIEAQGIDADSITRTLRGGVKFNLRDGAVKGFDLQKLLRQAKELYAANKGDDSSLTAPPEDETKFSELSGSLAIDNGIANNDDLDMKAPAFRVAGKGTASLVEQTIDYLLTVNIVDSIEGQGGAELNDLKNVPIPVTITGNLESPNYGIDLAALVKDKATDELKKKLQEELQDQLKLNVPQSSDTATETTSGEAAAAAGATPEQQADQPPEADKDPEDVLKDELKKKLLKGLFN
jgi:AsmA protein